MIGTRETGAGGGAADRIADDEGDGIARPRDREHAARWTIFVRE